MEENKQSFYKSIYSLKLVELEILKIYIKTNLVNTFIWPFKFFATASILLSKKLKSNFYLCIDYQTSNNLTNKNCILLLLICKLFNQKDFMK